MEGVSRLREAAIKAERKTKASPGVIAEGFFAAGEVSLQDSAPGSLQL